MYLKKSKTIVIKIGSSIIIDKNITKLIANSIGVSTPGWIVLNKVSGNNLELHDNNSPKFSASSSIANSS